MILVFISFILGTLSGTITGLIPGLHINLISSIILLSTLNSTIPSWPLVAFIISMSITHTFLNFIPSVLLGAPEEDSFLAILPGHELMQKGKGYEAIVLTLYGSLISLPIVLLLSPFMIYILPISIPFITKIVPFILVFISLYLVLTEKEIFLSASVFILSGTLGFLSFNLPVKEPLLPLLSGLFGTSSLLISLKNKIPLPKQKIVPLRKIKISKGELIASTLSSLISSPFGSFLPGIGAGHAAVLGSEIIPQTKKSFLFLVGSINTAIMALSFVVAYSIGKSRTGSAAAVKTILSEISFADIQIIILLAIFSGILSFFLGIFISKQAVKYFNKINYNYLTISIISLIFILNLIFSNMIGIIILATGTFIGIFCILSGSRRINLMGALLLPTILFYILY